MSWSKRFVPAIPLPSGGFLETLSDARAYVLALPDEVQHLPKWHAAVEALLLVAAEADGPAMFARIGMMVALYPRGAPVFDPERKAPTWRRAKLLRDRRE